MNGKTHQISGMTAVFATTALAIEAHPWVVKSLPEWLAPWFSPPATLLAAAQLLTPAEARVAMAEGALPANTMTITSSAPTSSLSGLPITLGGLAHYAVDTGSVLLTLLGIALLGLVVGQLPDLDTPYSTISNGGEAVSDMIKGKGLFRVLLRFVFNLLNFIPQVLSLFAGRMMGGHRNGIVHGLLGWFGFTALFGWFAAAVLHQPFYGLLFFVAYCTHLIVDSFSHSGIKWLWPASDRSYHLLPKSVRFLTANPLHNAMAQIASVLLADWAIYSLVVSLSRGEQPASLAGTTSSSTISGLQIAVLAILIIVSLVIIAGITLAAIAGQRQFKRDERRSRYRQQAGSERQYYRRQNR